MLHFDDIVFGPIYSRRLGSSLGVNILPSKGKLCNFDCVYCECGWNRDGISDGRFPTLEEIETAMRLKFPVAGKVDSITFSGNGEPTLHPDFPAIVDLTLKLRDEFLPSAKISVLSNATMLSRDAVCKALMKIDNPILKLDAPFNDLAGLINRPGAAYDVEKVVENLKKFHGNFVLQTMFFRSDDFETLNEQSLNAWYSIVRTLKPREIMVYTIDRETPLKGLTKYSTEEMLIFAEPLKREGFNVRISG